jgi:hypothetical protein
MDELPLASALVKLLKADLPSWPAGVLAVGGLSPTERRLEEILIPGSVPVAMPSPRDWAVSAAVVVALFGFGLGSRIAIASEPVAEACPIQPAAECLLLVSPSSACDRP